MSLKNLSVRPNFTGMTREELAELVGFYRQGEDAERVVIDAFMPIVVGDYLSPYCPLGYDTALAYLAKNDPVTLSFMDDEIEASEPDEEWLRVECLRVNMRRVEVPGSKWHARQGVFTAWSYPVALLTRRFEC